jgi:hypothetical protein
MRGRDAASLLVVAVGLVSSGGWLLGSPALVLLGRATGASPLPVVFSAIRGHEYWSATSSVSIEGQDGVVETLGFGRREFARLPGPHALDMLLVLPVALAPVIPQRMWLPALRYDFCAGGPLARAAGIETAPDRLVVTLTPRPGRGRRRHFLVTCRT